MRGVLTLLLRDSRAEDRTNSARSGSGKLAARRWLISVHSSVRLPKEWMPNYSTVSFANYER